MAKQFLPLTEYASKHRVSISTLRRRIKAEDIKFVFEDGKYLILDEPISTHEKVHRPSLEHSEATISGSARSESNSTNFSQKNGLKKKNSNFSQMSNIRNNSSASFSSNSSNNSSFATVASFGSLAPTGAVPSASGAASVAAVSTSEHSATAAPFVLMTSPLPSSAITGPMTTQGNQSNPVGQNSQSNQSGQWNQWNQGNQGNQVNNEPVLSTANRLLTELKKAYSQILQEKEDQILHLKDELTDLKTLIRVLESENERLRVKDY